MAAPTRYTPSYDFESFQSGHPQNPLPADKVDDELAALKASTDSIIDSLAQVRRDDGAINNQKVSPDTLKRPTTSVGARLLAVVPGQGGGFVMSPSAIDASTFQPVAGFTPDVTDTLISVSTAPSSGAGAIGDHAFAADNDGIYFKTGAAEWTFIGFAPGFAPTGHVLSDNGVPADATGVDGDFYVDTWTSRRYAKIDGEWEVAGALVGDVRIDDISGMGGGWPRVLKAPPGVYDVTRHGYKAGVGSDTQKLIDAATECYGNGGGTLFFPPSSDPWYYEKGVPVGSYVKVDGSNGLMRAAGTYEAIGHTENPICFFYNPNIDATDLTDEDIQLENMRFHGNAITLLAAVGNVPCGIYMRRARNVMVTNVHATDVGNCTAFLKCEFTVTEKSSVRRFLNAGFDHWESAGLVKVVHCLVKGWIDDDLPEGALSRQGIQSTGMSSGFSHHGASFDFYVAGCTVQDMTGEFASGIIANTPNDPGSRSDFGRWIGNKITNCALPLVVEGPNERFHIIGNDIEIGAGLASTGIILLDNGAGAPNNAIVVANTIVGLHDAAADAIAVHGDGHTIGTNRIDGTFRYAVGGTGTRIQIHRQHTTGTYTGVSNVSGADVNYFDTLTPSANVQSLLSAADYAAMRTQLGLVIGTNVQAHNANLDTFAGIAPSSNVQSLLAAANYLAMRTLLTLVPGTDVQAYNANLTTYAGIAPSANVQSLLGAASYSAMRALLSLVPGTNVQTQSANLNTFAGIAPSSNVQSVLGAADYAAIRTLLGLVISTNVQAYSANLTTFAGIAPSANIQSLLAAADYAAARAALSLVPGTNVQAFNVNLTTFAGVTPATGIATFLGTPTSANLAAAVTDETGTGPLVFAAGPTITSPTIGTGSGDSVAIVNAGNGNTASFKLRNGGSERWIYGRGSLGGSDNFEIFGYSTLTLEMAIAYTGGGVVIGSPTGSFKGSGNLNAQAVYDDNSLLTCYPFEAYIDGKVDLEKWDARAPDRVHPDVYDVVEDTDAVPDQDGKQPTKRVLIRKGFVEKRQHFGARKFTSRLGTEFDPLDIDKFGAHWKQKRHLTTMPNKDKYDPVNGAMSTGELIQRLVETVEIQAIHIDKLHSRLKTLESAS